LHVLVVELICMCNVHMIVHLSSMMVCVDFSSVAISDSLVASLYHA